MAKKFVRNITNSKLRGNNKEPLDTNVQNDLLSDEEDAFIRNKNEYHCLTDNIKSISITDNDLIKVNTTGKNTRRLDVSDLVNKISTLEGYITSLETRIKDLEDLNIYSRLTDIENRIIALEE